MTQVVFNALHPKSKADTACSLHALEECCCIWNKNTLLGIQFKYMRE
jgi:hypothetical protein